MLGIKNKTRSNRPKEIVALIPCQLSVFLVEGRTQRRELREKKPEEEIASSLLRGECTILSL